MRKSISMIVVLIGAVNGLAAEAYDPAALASRIAPFLDDQTFAVARIDVKRVDLAPVEAFVEQLARTAEPQTQAADEAVSQIKATRQRAARWITDFIKAGSSELFLVASMADFPEMNKPFLVAPLAPGADAQAIAGLLCSGEASGPTSRPAEDNAAAYPNMVCERIGQAVFAGSKSTLERLRTMRPAPRPELARMLEAAGDAPVQILVLPTADTRRVIEEMLPNLPEQAGGGPITLVTHGFLWAAISIQTRPDVALNMVIQSQDAEAAQAFASVLDKVFQSLRQDGVAKEFPQSDEILNLLKPAVQGDRLKLGLNAEAVRTAMTRSLAPSLLRARQQAKRSASAANVRQIVLGCIMYSADHKGQWPEKLSMIDSYLKTKTVLVNPQRPNDPVGYVYVRPTLSSDSKPGQVPVVYEVHESWGDGIWVGYADGHVEFVKNQTRFEQQLDKAKDATAPASR